MRTYSNPFRYEIPKVNGELIEPSKSCTYKMWFGSRYMIWKGKALHQSLNNVAIQLDRGVRHGVSKESAFIKVVDYIKKARITYFTVDVMLMSDIPAALLRSELLLLRKAKNDPNCLNVYFEPYIPQWIPLKEIKQYEKWKEQLNKNKKPAAKNNKVLSARKNDTTSKKRTTKRRSTSITKTKKRSSAISKKQQRNNKASAHR